jgi:hypothetical protein
MESIHVCGLPYKYILCDITSNTDTQLKIRYTINTRSVQSRDKMIPTMMLRKYKFLFCVVEKDRFQ